MKKKIFIFIFIILLTASCGKKGDPFYKEKSQNFKIIKTQTNLIT